jgi:hypothetical protein
MRTPVMVHAHEAVMRVTHQMQRDPVAHHASMHHPMHLAMGHFAVQMTRLGGGRHTAQSHGHRHAGNKQAFGFHDVDPGSKLVTANGSASNRTDKRCPAV